MRGERIRYSAETTSHRLKKIGLVTRRLGKAGKGLVLDLASVARVLMCADTDTRPTNSRLPDSISCVHSLLTPCEYGARLMVDGVGGRCQKDAEIS